MNKCLVTLGGLLSFARPGDALDFLKQVRYIQSRPFPSCRLLKNKKLLAIHQLTEIAD